MFCMQSSFDDAQLGGGAGAALWSKVNLDVE